MAPSFLLRLMITLLMSLHFLQASLSEPTYVSFSLTNRDAQASLIRSQDADPSDLPEGMPMREFVAAGRAMRARERGRWGRPAGHGAAHGHRRPAHVVAGSFSYSNEIAGDFYLTMSIGSPPQKIIFILDSGSELTWAQCKPCKVCSEKAGAPDFYFKKSLSFRPVPCSSRLCSGSLGMKAACENSTSRCTFELRYGDASLSAGYIAVDSFHLSKAMVKPLVFGCATTNVMTASTPTSGLIGLSPGPFSFTSQLLGGNSKLSKRFAYCVPGRFADLNSEGAILFGDYRLSAKLSYTPLQPLYEPLGELFYYVKLEGISVGKRFIKAAMYEKEAGLEGGGTIFDSGTAITRLVRPLYVELAAEVRRQTLHLHPFANATKGPGGSGSDVCYRVPLDAQELPQVPLITMHFAGGVGLELGPDSVLLPNESDAKGVTLCLAFGTLDSTPNINLIGNYQQQNYWVEHNLQTFTLGLAKVKSCAKP